MAKATKHMPTVAARRELSVDERAAVQDLAATCEAADGVHLKLTFGEHDHMAPAEPRCFLAVDGGMIVGFCSLDGGSALELCGMVRPDYRRRGIGRMLLDAARLAAWRATYASVLVICEHTSPTGRAFAVAVGGVLRFSELHMRHDSSPVPTSTGVGITLRRASAADADALALVTGTAFGDPPDLIRGHIVRELAEPEVRFYLGLQGDTPVGALKVYSAPGRASIYAFGVRPEYHHRGIGRYILTDTIGLLRAEGRDVITLEVDPDNTPAFNLYRSCGFRIVTRYDYYSLPARQP